MTTPSVSAIVVALAITGPTVLGIASIWLLFVVGAVVVSTALSLATGAGLLGSAFAPAIRRRFACVPCWCLPKR